jgi:hypothetical protein
MIDFPAFSAGERHYSATDVIDAAWFRGEVQSCWETSMLGAARKQRADEEGLEPDSETLQHLSEDVRYRHDLITAEETEAWLTARGLTLDDLTGHAYRRYWREHSAAAPTPAGPVYIAGSPEERSVFLHDVIFDGEFAQLAEHLSWRAVGALVLEVPPTSGELEAARERFLQRTALRPEQLAPALGQLGRDAAWLGHMLALESAYERQCAQLCTAENRVRTLAALRLPLTSFTVELMDLDSADAVREACLCVSAADISMEELAGQEHRLIERRQLLLEDLPEDAQQQFLSAEPGHVLPFITEGERFQVCRIAEKREPALSDASVCARVDADLRTGHFGNLAAKHIMSAVAPPSAP